MKRRKRRQSVIPNPFTSRNKWAIRGRAIGYFFMSLLFTIANFIAELVIRIFSAIWQVVASWYQSRQVNKKQKRLGKEPVVELARKGTVTSQPERDDVVEALRSLGCTLKESRLAAAAARKKLGSNASDEDLVKAALQSFRQERS